LRGSNGWATRISTTTKALNITSAATSSDTVTKADVQPCEATIVKPYTKQEETGRGRDRAGQVVAVSHFGAALFE
jgi:hypothetical protein